MYCRLSKLFPRFFRAAVTGCSTSRTPASPDVLLPRKGRPKSSAPVFLGSLELDLDLNCEFLQLAARASAIEGVAECARWTTVCRSKDDGGLGVKDLAVLNKSLMMKHVHKLFTGE
nr:unnamed protein product [Digitaria exilis]